MKKFNTLVFALLSILLLMSSLAACGSAGPAASGQTTAAGGDPVSATADPTATIDRLLGSWQDVNFADRFATIAKTDSGYEYEDNEGKYPATFADGILKVQVTDSKTADVYLDAKSGHMLAKYQEGAAEFSKK